MNIGILVLLYTDPGFGALMWQLIAASLIGGAYYFRHYGAKLKALFTSSKNKRVQSESTRSKNP